MKAKLFASLLAGVLVSGYTFGAQVDTTAQVNKENKTTGVVKIGGISIKTDRADSTKKVSSRFSFQLTLARVDLGLATFLDKGSYTLSDPLTQNLEHERWKTHNFGFEVLQTGYRFNSYFKVYLAAGLDWNHIRLKKNVTVLPEERQLSFKEEDIKFEKNRFSSTYLRVPLSFQIRSKDDQKGNKVYFVFGPEVGFLINGKTKQVSEENGKVKFKDDFNLNPFRYGASARLGYGLLGLYAKYYANDVFADNQGPEDFKNLNFGLMFGF